MGDEGNETDNEAEDPSGGPLVFQADADFAKNNSGTHKTGEFVDTDGDGVADAIDEAQFKYGTDSDGDDDDDDDDDDAENDADSLADLEDDDNDLINDTDYKNIDRYGSRFNDYYQNATVAQRAAVDTAKQAEQTALQGPRNADGFVALQKARIDERLAATAIIANNGSGTDAQKAAAGNPKLAAMDQKFARLQTELQGKTEAQKDAILAKAFPAQWQKYEESKPQQATGPRSGASYSSAQNDLPGGGTQQPFSQTLSAFFAKAVLIPESPAPTVTPAPALASATPTVRVQAQSYTA